MTVALLDEYRPLALGVAARFYLPGGDRDDVEQEAMIGLWEAVRSFDGSSPFPAFARVVIRRRLADALKVANRGKHKPLTLAVRHQTDDEGETCDVVDLLGTTVTEPHRVAAGRETLAAACTAHRALTELEREAWRRSVNELPYGHDKRLDNAQQRAVRKLRKAAA